MDIKDATRLGCLAHATLVTTAETISGSSGAISPRSLRSICPSNGAANTHAPSSSEGERSLATASRYERRTSPPPPTPSTPQTSESTPPDRRNARRHSAHDCSIPTSSELTASATTWRKHAACAALASATPAGFRSPANKSSVDSTSIGPCPSGDASTPLSVGTASWCSEGTHAGTAASASSTSRASAASRGSATFAAHTRSVAGANAPDHAAAASASDLTTTSIASSTKWSVSQSPSFASDAAAPALVAALDASPALNSDSSRVPRP